MDKIVTSLVVTISLAIAAIAAVVIGGVVLLTGSGILRICRWWMCRKRQREMCAIVAMRPTSPTYAVTRMGGYVAVMPSVGAPFHLRMAGVHLVDAAWDLELCRTIGAWLSVGPFEVHRQSEGDHVQRGDSDLVEYLIHRGLVCAAHASPTHHEPQILARMRGLGCWGPAAT